MGLFSYLFHLCTMTSACLATVGDNIIVWPPKWFAWDMVMKVRLDDQTQGLLEDVATIIDDVVLVMYCTTAMAGLCVAIISLRIITSWIVDRNEVA